MQSETLLVFFGKAVEAVVVLGGRIYNSRVRLLYSGLAKFLDHARSILLYIACKFNQRAAGLRTHAQSIPRSYREKMHDTWAAIDFPSTSFRLCRASIYVSLRNCAENVITSPVADPG